jgi:D-alanine-D-alanine ligase
MGGPDAEREVSIASGEAVAAALARRGYDTRSAVIDEPATEELAAVVDGAAAVFPALHGPFGEGGRLQRMLEAIGVPFVGSGGDASRLAIDKLATKQAAAALVRGDGGCGAVGVSVSWVVDGALDTEPPGPLPLALKPNFEGSTVGLRLCETMEAWREAVSDAAAANRATIAEPMVRGREVTIGVLGRSGGGGELRALPMIAIEPAGGVYDFAAKYERSDTRYRFGAGGDGLDERALAAFSVELCERVSVRDLARADFIHDPASGTSWFLELNTMPGFTSHSLVPMAAEAAGIGFDDLCAALIDAALARSPGVAGIGATGEHRTGNPGRGA